MHLLNRDAGSPETYTWFQSSSAKAVAGGRQPPNGCGTANGSSGYGVTPIEPDLAQPALPVGLL